MRWFSRKKPDPLKTVDEIYKAVEIQFNQRLAQLQATEQRLLCDLLDLQKKHSELITKVREQTEADILLMVKRIERDILADKKISQTELDHLAALRQQQLALQSQNSYGYGLGALNIFSALARTGGISNA